jgi:uncharacterized protein YwgA
VKKGQLSSKDLLLALLYSPGIHSTSNEPIDGRTRLTKMVYLFEKEIYKQFFDDLDIALPQFEPYHYGPFSKQLFEDLKFFTSIGFIDTKETIVPISSAEKYEVKLDGEEDDDDCWDCASFVKDSDDVELRYYLSENGKKYVQENIWGIFSESQQKNLANFKRNINAISLDSLLSYVYNKYPEDAAKSRIAERYIEKDDENNAGD